MKTYKSQSTVMPQEWDTTSSETTVYHNENIVEQPATETSPVMYNYDVTEYTKSEYIKTQLEQSKADIDYLAIMMGVVL